MFLDEVSQLWVINPEIVGKKVLIYGVGEVGHKIYKSIVSNGICECIGFYDSKNLSRDSIFGLKLYTKEELLELDKMTPIVIGTERIRTFQAIAKELIELGFKNIIVKVWPSYPSSYDIEESRRIINTYKRDIERAYQLLTDEKSKEVYTKILEYRLTNDVKLLHEVCELGHKQYFPTADIFVLDEEEVFIDAGCYNTSTIQDLKEWSNNQYKKVYAFEPSESDMVVVKEYIEFRNYRAEAVKAGLYNKNGRVSFTSTDMGLSTIEEYGNDSINVVTLDDFMKEKDEKVTFIKMDIEGVELEALEGSYKTIEKDHPKLAICIYHKFEDMWKILLWINEKFPGYKFYIRHYSSTDNETVLYARYEY